MRAVNLFAWYHKYKIYRRLKVVAHKELACIHRAKVGFANNSETAKEYASQLNSYIGLAKQWHYGYKFISPIHYLDGRIKFKLSKDRLKEEVQRVYIEELKKMA